MGSDDLDAHEAAAGGPHRIEDQRKSGKRMRRRAARLGAHRGDEELDVRRGRVRKNARDHSPGHDAYRHGTAPQEDVLQARQRLSPYVAQIVVGGDGLRAFVDDAKREVVLQVFADAGQVVDHGYAVFLEQRRRAHAGQLQQLRRLQRAGAQEDFARSPHAARFTARDVAHAAGALALEQHAGRVRSRFHGQVGTPARRAQVGHRGRRSAGRCGW